MRSRRAALTSRAPLLASNTARFAQRTWLFDLDNTLHNASAHIFPHIGRAMRHTHQFHDLPGMVVAERGLKAMLCRLPGRKLIFSNAPLAYTEAILAITGIRRCFDAVYSVERLRFQPKPSTRGFLRLLRDEGLDPRACIMVEDTLPNLETAKRLGMRTVWVSPLMRSPPCADVRVRSVLDLPGRLGQL